MGNADSNTNVEQKTKSLEKNINASLVYKGDSLNGSFGFNGKDGTFDSTVYKRQDIFIRVKTLGGIQDETVSKAECVTDLFYGTDYNSHLGTKRGGLATYAQGEGFMRSIHNLESSYFRTKFESELPKFKGSSGIGIISDTDPQPIVINSHLGKLGGDADDHVRRGH